MQTWFTAHIMSIAEQWYTQIRARTCPIVSANSLWWHFSRDWHHHKVSLIEQFIKGEHHFSPMTRFCFVDESHQSWDYVDRLAIKLILMIIRPTFQHLISKRCYHLSGPSGVARAIKDIQRALDQKTFQYVIRADIKSYYASIDRAMLHKMLNHHYQDPRLQNYFEQIVNHAIDKGGDIFVPTTGIPRRSSLSPFFGALYLSELDEALSQRKGIEYFRYMDDIIILAQTQKQYRRAKKILFEVLERLRLKLSPSKTKMGRIDSNFHFLGANFEVTRIPQSKPKISVSVHSRTCTRAKDRVQVMQEDAVHPATQQHYLIRWASWWNRAIDSNGIQPILLKWVLYAMIRAPTMVWLGRGLLTRQLAHCI